MKQVSIGFGVILFAAQPAWAQATTDGEDARAFEVVSIKRSASDTRPMNNIFPVRYTATGTTLTRLIMTAYNVGPHELSGASGWMESERYDVVAKAPEGSFRGPVGRSAEWANSSGAGASWTALDPNSETSRRFRAMVQALLADRFRLKLHRETKELSAYALVVAKGGLKAKPPTSDNVQMKSGLGQITYQGAPLSLLATTLTWLTGRLVVDQTGLKNNYDFTLRWTPDEGQVQMLRGAGDPGNNGAAEDGQSGPSLFTALKEQLGLKLEMTKAPVEILVVDDASRPSEN